MTVIPEICVAQRNKLSARRSPESPGAWDRPESKTDALQQGQVDLVKGHVTLIRWMVGGLTVVGLTVTLVKLL